MNPELYTEEFRDFKYLKSPYEAVQFYKKAAESINNVQPWHATNDPSFRWPSRIEFFEQILDLHDDAIYLVDPGHLVQGSKGYLYETATIMEIKRPLLYQGTMLSPDIGTPLGIEDIPLVEAHTSSDEYYICSGGFIYNRTDGHIIPSGLLPIVYKNPITLSAMFYDEMWAERYQQALTEFLRGNLGAISTISGLF